MVNGKINIETKIIKRKRLRLRKWARYTLYILLVLLIVILGNIIAYNILY